MTICKRELAKMVQDLSSYKLNTALSKDVVESVLSAIMNSVARGDKVVLNNFGAFYTKEIAEHEGINPATGEKIHVAASTKVCFKTAARFKQLIN